MEKTYDKVFNSFLKKKDVFEGVLYIENSAGDHCYSRATDGLDIDSPMVIASITKLFTSACIFMLCEQGKLSLEDKVIKHIAKQEISGICVYKGHDYTDELRIIDLVSMNAGIADDFESGENSELRKMFAQGDYDYPISQAIEIAKKTPAHFKPGDRKNGFYGDINFDLLGIIIEKVTNKSFDEVCKESIFQPLSMNSTHFINDEDETMPHIYLGNMELTNRNKFLKSSKASGGAISTSREIMVFLKAFFTNKLFDNRIFEEYPIMRHLQPSFGPILYGCGHMQIPLKSAYTLYQGKGSLIGHCGTTGSFAFYYPEKDLYYVGNLNQMAKPQYAIQIAMRLAMTK